MLAFKFKFNFILKAGVKISINTLVRVLIMLYILDFIRKISAKVFVIIKTCSASGGSAPDPRFGGFPP